MHSWNLKPGFLKIRDWVPDFTPYKIKSTIAQIWVRIYNLPIEYWHEEVFVGIVRSVGTPLKIDGNSLHGPVGHFARILIEVDMASVLQTSVMIDRGEASFFIDLYYENVPLFCSARQVVGHATSKCQFAKGVNKGVQESSAKEGVHKSVYGNSGEANKRRKGEEIQKVGLSTNEWVVKSFGDGNHGRGSGDLVGNNGGGSVDGTKEVPISNSFSVLSEGENAFDALMKITVPIFQLDKELPGVGRGLTKTVEEGVLQVQNMEEHGSLSDSESQTNDGDNSPMEVVNNERNTPVPFK
ncbi:hypothetical protein C2S51_008790 [Perilla frutescens var. frutescens]|nr:hypothetical protein C2S51_008790 [Perilla frutescens var. frutescens]